MKVKKAYWPTIILLGFLYCKYGGTILNETSWQLITVYAVILLAVILARKEFFIVKSLFIHGAL